MMFNNDTNTLASWLQGWQTPASLQPAIKLAQDGGPVVVLLSAMFTLVIAVTLLKVWQFYRFRLFDRRTANQALHYYRHGNLTDALALTNNSDNPAAKLLWMGINGLQQHVPQQQVQDELSLFGQGILNQLRGNLRVLEVIATLAPLLGLFGTVLGMINAFQQLEAAGSQVNPALLSGGIWVALLTTACGLAVAMPTVVILNWLDRSIDRTAQEMGLIAHRLFTKDLLTPPPLHH
jgi:biopolymer transport protein ExbB